MLDLGGCRKIRRFEEWREEKEGIGLGDEGNVLSL